MRDNISSSHEEHLSIEKKLLITFTLLSCSVSRVLGRHYRSMLLVVIGILIASVVTITSLLAKQGNETQEVDREIIRIENENKDLRLAIASASSLSAIRHKAVALGLSERKDVIKDLHAATLALR